MPEAARRRGNPWSETAMTSDDASAHLLAEILADPARDAARLVYADHLIEHGDPRGELVHVQCKLENLPWDDPARRPLERQVSDLLAVDETAWTRDVRALGFTDHLHQVNLRRGFVERVTVGAEQAPTLVPALRAITPLREVHARLRDVASIDGFGAAVADVEGVSVATSNLEVTRALARSFVGWRQHGKLRMLHGIGPELARSIAAVPALRGLDHLRLSAAGSGVG
ncbi:MAG: TIGR02996 domain-containing protein, partial [Deltaproteobacteria bacterium]|nr:TIGR02996 domain-containing protein [Deltaproteobacteria bacterium]